MIKFTSMACLVHAVFLVSIFDIYFKSHIISNLPNIGNDLPAFAHRLVLFVADGLRADTFFESDAAPYLRKKILQGSVWGVSKAHIPTESRPGHVSLIAGILEDPSAVFKGWKHNPVDFDSVFNQTALTFAWGSPDILSIFNKGNESCKINLETFHAHSFNKCHVYTEMYDPDFQDFSGASNSASELNDWVLKKFLSFIQMANASQTVKDFISREKVVFFLHLLGTDVSGHVNKPNSMEYIENIKVADEVVKQVVSVVSTFFNDDSTAFIFTSDHGMTDWGSHGAGSESEIDTPIVAWGAGMAYQEIQNFQSSGTWALPQFTRNDINQSDVAPLMSVLLGIPIPANSVGILPVNYLNATLKEKENLLYLNARQIENQFNRKRDNIKKSVFNWMFFDYPDMNIEKQNYTHMVIREKLTKSLVNNSVQIHFINSFISNIISGLEYYNNFHQLFLCLLITFSYLGWILFLTVSLIAQDNCERVSDSGDCIVLNIIFFINGCALSLFVAMQSFPLMIHLYIWVATSVWWAFAKTLKNMTYNHGALKQTLFHIVGYSLLYILGIEALVLAFFKREILSGIILVILFWPIRKPFMYRKKYFLIVWIWSCLCLSFFPFFPTVGFNKNYLYILLCGALWLFGGFLFLLVDSVRCSLNFKVHCAVLFEIFSAIINIYFLLHNRGPYVIVNYALSWVILFSSLLLLYFGPVTFYPRYLHIISSLCAPYLLLSIGHEVFFTLILAINLLCWIYFEHQGSCYNSELTQLRGYQVSEELLSHNDLRRSFFFLFYILFSFFGIGNVASINSFDVSWVYCFLSVFSPFTMTGLILLKTIIPFLMVAVAFRLINIITKANTKRLFLILFIMCDIMGLNFFFRVTNKGSWLDIGLSISHYIIIETVILLLVAVYSIAVFITEPHSFRHYNLEPPGILPHHFSSVIKKHGD